jgi:NAD(P)-dependent dehydrogenase (short-subunit alcohol dehydrogenase family)
MGLFDGKVALVTGGSSGIGQAQANVSKASEVQAMVNATISTYGRLDYAFNNAGTGVGKSIHETTEEEWDLVMNTNLKGMWLCMKYELLVMLKQGGGVIVNNSSVGGVTFSGRIPIYRASKHGVIALSKSAAAVYRKSGIRVNVVCPGDIYTPLWGFAIRDEAVSIEQIETLRREGFLGEPTDIAKAVMWLCSDEASFIQGHALVIDGGLIVS